jgi:hypothetical protein
MRHDSPNGTGLVKKTILTKNQIEVINNQLEHLKIDGDDPIYNEVDFSPALENLIEECEGMILMAKRILARRVNVKTQPRRK